MGETPLPTAKSERRERRDVRGQRQRHRGRERLFASVLTLSLSVVGLAVDATIAPAAQAATHGPYYDIGYGPLGAWSTGGRNVYCLEIQRAAPWGSTGGVSYQGWGGLSATSLARLNYVISTFGQSTDRRWTAAVHLYVWSVTDSAYYNSHGMSGDVYYSARAGADEWVVRNRLAQVRAAAANISAGVTSGSASLSIQMFNSYDGQVVVTANPSRATGTLTLDGAYVAGTEGDTTAVQNGDVIPIRGIPLDTETDKYAVTANATFTVTPAANTYDPRIGVYTTGTAQRLAGPGPGLSSFNFNASEYVTDPLPLLFSPTVETQVATRAVQPGAAFVDTLQAGVAEGSEEWRANEAGVYHPVVARGVLYGPRSSPPTQSAVVDPTDPVAWSETITLNGPGSYQSSGGFVASQSGYYTWVWSIDWADQSDRVKTMMPESYYWQDEYGEAAETHVVPVMIGGTSQVSRAVVGLWGSVRDTLTLEHDEATGPWWVDATGAPVGTSWEIRSYFIEGTTPPAVSADPPIGAQLLAVETRSGIQYEGDYNSDWMPAPGRPGFIVYQWVLVDDVDNYVSWKDDFGLANETVRVEAPTLTTAADQLVALGDPAGDLATVGGQPTGQDTYLTFAAYLQAGEEPVCDVDNVVFDSAATPITVSAPGEYRSPEVEFDEVGTYAWIATLSAADGSVIAVGECGDPAEITVVETFGVTTRATSFTSIGGMATDTATVEGLTPAGSTIVFQAFLQTIAHTEPTCSLANRSYTSEAEPIALEGAGVYESPQARMSELGTYYWVETVYNRDGEVLHEGECGVKEETTVVMTLPITGASFLLFQLVLVGLSIAVGAALLTVGGLGRRRQRVNT